MNRHLLLACSLLPAITSCVRPPGAPTTREDPPAAAVVTPPPGPISCGEYQGLLRSLGDGLPPALAGVVIEPNTGEPMVAGSAAIELADREQVHWPVFLLPQDGEPKVKIKAAPTPAEQAARDRAAQPPPGQMVGGVVGGYAPRSDKPDPIVLDEPLPPWLYVSTRAGGPVAQVRSLRAQVPAGTELRLLVRRTDDELRALHLATFPRSPASITAMVPAEIGGDTFAALIEAAGTCRPVLEVFARARFGIGIDEIGPATAEAIAGCDCQLADLDGYVSLVGALLLPRAELGALPIRADVLDELPLDATVDDLARALAGG